MAQEVGGPPVLLLDDALGELDPKRQQRVLALDQAGQVLLTATMIPEQPTGSRMDVYAVREGTVTKGPWLPQLERY